MAERNHFIDIAKGIAIIFVLLNHYNWSEGSLFSTHLYYWIICMAVPIFMLCTGYVTAVSFTSKNITLKEAYSKKALFQKLSRYVLPVLWFYIAETILAFICRKTGYFDYLSTLDFPYKDGYGNKMTLTGSILFFFIGGRGLHGTYYFPIILQIAFMVPLIYYTVKKWKWGVWLLFGISLALELLKFPVNDFLAEIGISSTIQRRIYRLLAYRYVFAVALGCYMYIYRNNPGKWYKWLCFFIIGAGYIFLVNYLPYNRIIFTNWYKTAMPAMLFIAPLFLLGLKKLKTFRFHLLEEFGKASYHIMLVQILYYNFFAPLVWTAPKNIVANNFVGVVISIIICLGGGYGYYLLYNFVALKYKNFKTKSMAVR